MSDFHIEYLDAKYGEIELGRNLDMTEAIRILEGFLDVNPKSGDTPATEEQVAEPPVDEHTAVMQGAAEKTQKMETDITEVLEESAPESDTDEPVSIRSPKSEDKNS